MLALELLELLRWLTRVTSRFLFSREPRGSRQVRNDDSGGFAGRRRVVERGRGDGPLVFGGQVLVGVVLVGVFRVAGRSDVLEHVSGYGCGVFQAPCFCVGD